RRNAGRLGERWPCASDSPPRGAHGAPACTLATQPNWQAAAPASGSTGELAAAPPSRRAAPWRAAQAHAFQLPGFLRAIGWLCSPEMKMSDKLLESWQPSEFRYQWVT